MPGVRMCGVKWADPDLSLGSSWRCPYPATHVAVMMDMLSVVAASILVCERCKDLCKDMPHWGFVEIPEQYRTRR